MLALAAIQVAVWAQGNPPAPPGAPTPPAPPPLDAPATPTAENPTNATPVSVPPPGPPIYKDPDRPIPERVADLISRMTVEEKISLLDMDSPGVPRLEVPAYSWWSEGIHGVSRAGRATMFPQVIGLAATWNTNLLFRVATAISDEARAKYREAPTARYHGLAYWAPAVDCSRDPRWGRIMETYGEDPFLVTKFSVAFIRAMQGNDPHYLKTAACVKHLALYGQETGRHSTIFNASPRAIREYYLPTFQAGVQEGKAELCMTAYNGYVDAPCTINRPLITDLLRQEWGFQGLVASDYGAPYCLKNSFKVVDSHPKGLAAALSAGIDVFFQQEMVFSNLLEAVRGGLVTEEQLTPSLTRSLGLRFRFGHFDPPERVSYAKIPDSVVGCPEHVALALDSCRESLVLLKNDRVVNRADPSPILPLDRQKLESIAVLGFYGNQIQFGTYPSAPTAQETVTILRGIMNRAGDRVVVRHVPWLDPDEKRKQKVSDKDILVQQKDNLEAAIKAAATSDVAIVAVGLSEKNEFEGKDRIDIGLPKEQQEFAEKIFAVNPSTIAVLINGSPLAVTWLQEHIPAILEAWYPSEQAGNAIADVLFGDYNPAGRLPITFFASLQQLPPLNDYEVSNGRTYMYFKDKPLYPFGYGLSYTRFEYGNLRLDRDKVGANETLNASVDVKNAGSRDGDEVVQLYVHLTEPRIPVPIKQLRGFHRLKIPKGQTQTVTIPLKIADLGFWNEEARRYIVETGPYEIQIGASSSDIRARIPFRVE
jgi:beta-glucosidase